MRGAAGPLRPRRTPLGQSAGSLRSAGADDLADGEIAAEALHQDGVGVCALQRRHPGQRARRLRLDEDVVDRLPAVRRGLRVDLPHPQRVEPVRLQVDPQVVVDDDDVALGDVPLRPGGRRQIRDVAVDGGVLVEVADPGRQDVGRERERGDACERPAQVGRVPPGARAEAGRQLDQPGRLRRPERVGRPRDRHRGERDDRRDVEERQVAAVDEDDDLE